VEIAALFHWTWTEVSQLAVIMGAAGAMVTLTFYGIKRFL
jgi:hypothetical protein